MTTTGSYPSLGPLFENPITRVLAAAPPDLRAALVRQAEGPLIAGSQLKRQLAGRLLVLEAAALETEFVDLRTARRLATMCEALLDGGASASDDYERRLVQMAVGYFLDDDDAEDDIGSPIGFDDDMLVIELVAKELKRDDVLRLGADT